MFVGVHGVLQCLFAEFMGSQMIAFAMGNSSGGVRVGS
jgi:hypothetical protein